MAKDQHSPIRIVQITDTHLFSEGSGTLLKMNTKHSFQQVLELVRMHDSPPDLILGTGDIAQDASATAYEYFKSSIGALNAPFMWLPGNHDNALLMQSLAEGTSAAYKYMQLGNWLIVMLDTSVGGQVHGTLSAEELAFLSAQLDASELSDSVDHVLVSMHHNPIRGTAGWMKNIGLQNPQKFWETAKTSSKLRAIVYGHIHQELDFELEGIRCLCTPSTCIQFKPDVVNFALDKMNPGYRNLVLYSDGAIDTQVVRVAGEQLEADFSCGGY
ncbi:MAG: 3',5'-cyclic-AMP phosphodiesterase [Gammaproteobacteria bacterium]|nr:3',5'-cyclic-AMP phosphodiesterase [Gammaproteobacteria bacterium]